MAELFVAVARGAGEFAKPVAIKRILPQLAAERRFVEMFFEEAKLAASLDHPHVAKVFDFGEENGLPYLVMEFVHGVDLRGLLSATKSALPLEIALTIVVQLAEALHYVHEHRDVRTGNPLGLVHRDVTPSNVLLGYAGGVKLTDFGIVKATEMTAYTATGALKGKLPYLSPEQARCERLDRRSDVYALGLVLFELTTGRRMHSAVSEVGLLARVCDGKYLPPSVVDETYDAELETIVERALAPELDRRYPTARALASDLEQLAVRRQWTLSVGKLCEYLETVIADPGPIVLRTITQSTPNRAANDETVEPEVPPKRTRARSLAIASALLGVGIGAVGGLGLATSEPAADPSRDQPLPGAVVESARVPEEPAAVPADPHPTPVAAGPKADASEKPSGEKPAADPPKRRRNRSKPRKSKRKRAEKPAEPRHDHALLPPSQRPTK